MQLAEAPAISWDDLCGRAQLGDRSAIDEVRTLLRDKVIKQAVILWQRKKLKEDAGQFSERVVSLANMWLRSQSDWRRFTSQELLKNEALVFLFKVLIRPDRDGVSPAAVRKPKENDPRFQLDALSKPLEEVSGDWFVGEVAKDGALWLLIADVTSHGWPAHALAAGLPLLWDLEAVRDLRERGMHPSSVLEHLSRELLDSNLPTGIFVDATLARFDFKRGAAEVVIAAAGDCRSLRHRPQANQIEHFRFGSSYLGSEWSHDPPKEKTWPLQLGDEWLLSSDGLYDQPSGSERLVQTLSNMTSLSPPHRSLSPAVKELLDRALAACPQHDDITKVVVRFCSS